jgi:ribosomal protein S18 acetylase RimI-like enzyme
VIEVRPVRAEEQAAAGRATRAAYAALHPGREGGDPYLEMIADVAERSVRTTVLVAVEDGEVLGSVTVELAGTVNPDGSLTPDEAHLRMLGVSPSAQGRGAGRALVQAAVELARAAGKRRLTLGTMAEMTAAQRLYRSLGFAEGPTEEYAPGLRYLTYELTI